jgi:hypothetical protein
MEVFIMLLAQEQLKSLKRVNVSKDSEKTKERIRQDYKSASKAEKKAILELSGQGATSIYRIYTVGAVTPRIVLSFAQTLNVNPLYYTGEADERGVFEKEQVLRFLKAHGYDNLYKELNKKRKADKKLKNEPNTETVKGEITDKNEVISDAATKSASVTTEIRLVFSNEPKMKKAVDELTAQEASELLHTLFIRAKGGGEAEHIANVVKRCLLK